MATASAGTSNTKYTAANNANDRSILLKTGIPMLVNLGKSGPFAAGSSARIKLRNVGVLTNLRLRVEAEIAITATATPSPDAPYNFLTNIVTQDYNTTQRIFAPGDVVFHREGFVGDAAPGTEGVLP